MAVDRIVELVLAAAIVVFTGCLLWVSKGQWDVMDKQLGVMQSTLEAMQRDQRPFVSIIDTIERPRFFKLEPDIGQIVWNWHYTNFGKSVASDVRIHEFIKVGNSIYQRGIRPKGPIHAGEIPPGKTNFGTAVSNKITEAEFNRLLGVDGGIGILLEFTYLDGTGKQYSNPVCLEHLAIGAIALPDPAKCTKAPE